MPVTLADLGIGQLFWQIPDAVVIGDAATGRIVLWNPAAEQLFGYTPEEVVGQPIEIIVPERLRPAHRAGLARYVATGHGAVIDSPAAVELPALHRAGREVAVELRLSPLTHSGGGGPFVLAVIRDVTVRKQLEAEQALRAQVEGVLLTARTFEHELNTKLTATIAYAQMLLRDSDLPPHLRRRAQSVLDGAQEAARIIGQVLELTEVDVTDWGRHGTTISVPSADEC